MPVQFWTRAAALLDVVERTGRWPPVHLEGYLAFAGNGAGDAPLEQRPLTILTILYHTGT